VENFHRFNSLKYSTAAPKAFTVKGLYMIATILKSEVAKVSRSVKKIKKGKEG